MRRLRVPPLRRRAPGDSWFVKQGTEVEWKILTPRFVKHYLANVETFTAGDGQLYFAFQHGGVFGKRIGHGKAPLSGRKVPDLQPIGSVSLLGATPTAGDPQVAGAMIYGEPQDASYRLAQSAAVHRRRRSALLRLPARWRVR
jgi:uncharacterized cupin superfamily protein